MYNTFLYNEGLYNQPNRPEIDGLSSSTESRSVITDLDSLVSSVTIVSSSISRSVVGIDTEIFIAMDSRTETRSLVIIQFFVECSSSTETRGTLDLDTNIIISLLSSTDTRANYKGIIYPTILSSTDSRTITDTTTNLQPTIVSITDSRSEIVIYTDTLHAISQTEDRSILEIDCLVTLGLISNTESRNVLLLFVPPKSRMIIGRMRRECNLTGVVRK